MLRRLRHTVDAFAPTALGKYKCKPRQERGAVMARLRQALDRSILLTCEMQRHPEKVPGWLRVAFQFQRIP